MTSSEPLDKYLLGGSFRDREQVIEAFEQQWMSGKPPVIEQYLSSNVEAPQLLLVELIQSDLEFQLKRNSMFRIEAYLDRFAVVKENREALLTLIRGEYRLRKRATPWLELLEYENRFGGHIPDLAGLLEQLSLDSLEFSPNDATSIRQMGLWVSNGPLARTRFSMPADRPMLVGRGLQSDTNINDPRMSRVHFSIAHVSDRYELSDANSSSGTSVNGTKVDACELNAGDIIQASDTFFRFQVL